MCLEKYEEALVDFGKAISMRPEWPLYYCNRAKLLLKLDRKELALEDLNKAYKYSLNLVASP